MHRDTMFAIAATIIGTICVLISAIGLISVCVVPLGSTPVAVSLIVAAVVSAVLLAGGFWVWMLDRRGRAF